MQLKPVRITKLCNYVTIIHLHLTFGSNILIQPNTYINKAFSSTSTRFNPYGTLAGVITYNVLNQPK